MLLTITTYLFTLSVSLIIFSDVYYLENNILSHIILSIISYSLLFMGFILSFMLNYQQQTLHSHKLNSKIIKILPSLEKTESLLFNNIYLSFITLSLAILSGFLFLDDMFVQHLVHKTFFSIFSWILLLAIIIARIAFGLRDKKATRTIQLAFILVVVGYFGTKLALIIFN